MLNHTKTWKSPFHQPLGHPEPQGRKRSFKCSRLPRAWLNSTTGRKFISPLLHTGSDASGRGIVNCKHYELFTGQEMTEQSAESATHRSQRGEKNSLWCWCPAVTIAHSLCHTSAKGRRRLLTGCSPYFLSELLYVPGLKKQWSSQRQPMITSKTHACTNLNVLKHWLPSTTQAVLEGDQK